MKRNAQPDDINTTLINNTLKMKLPVSLQTFFHRTSTFMILFFLYINLRKREGQMILFYESWHEAPLGRWW